MKQKLLGLHTTSKSTAVDRNQQRLFQALMLFIHWTEADANEKMAFACSHRLSGRYLSTREED
jgi:hypothetical protein